MQALQAEAQGLREALEAAQEEKAQSEEWRTVQASTEAMLRRLDNERQYLRSQLQSEITLKNELQEALDRTAAQLGELRASSRSQFDDLEAKLRAAERRADASNLSLDAAKKISKLSYKPRARLSKNFGPRTNNLVNSSAQSSPLWKVQGGPLAG